MNPCGKKNTGSGKAAGCPWTSHDCMNSTLYTRSFTHDPSVLSEAKETFSHILGSWLLRNEVYMESKSELITINPLMAFLMSLRDEFIFLINLNKSTKLLVESWHEQYEEQAAIYTC
jgi:hypothetical protein